MDQEMKIYHEVVFGNYSTQEFLRHLHNPVRQYENEIIDGPFCDFGCGQTSFLLDYVNYNRDFFAIDSEQSQLDMLSKRVDSLKDSNKAIWNYLNSDFFNEQWPKTQFSIIFLSNILHFFDLNQCAEIINKILQHTLPGSLIYVSVHSDKFYANNPENPNNNEYFKHYFSIEDLENLFKKENFEKLYIAEIQKADSARETEIVDMWLEETYVYEGVTDRKIIELGKKEYLENKMQSDVICIFKRK